MLSFSFFLDIVCGLFGVLVPWNRFRQSEFERGVRSEVGVNNTTQLDLDKKKIKTFDVGFQAPGKLSYVCQKPSKRDLKAVYTKHYIAHNNF